MITQIDEQLSKIRYTGTGSFGMAVDFAAPDTGAIALGIGQEIGANGAGNKLIAHLGQRKNAQTKM